MVQAPVVDLFIFVNVKMKMYKIDDSKCTILAKHFMVEIANWLVPNRLVFCIEKCTSHIVFVRPVHFCCYSVITAKSSNDGITKLLHYIHARRRGFYQKLFYLFIEAPYSFLNLDGDTPCFFVNTFTKYFISVYPTRFEISSIDILDCIRSSTASFIRIFC